MANCQRSARQVLISAVKGYQYLVSPMLGHCCRFYPSCSHYTTEAINVHGVVKGGWMSIKRLLRCQPWHPGGVDFVPGSYKLPNQRDK
ncbi:MAG: membrane protein insertion efficiency factor YidD [Gammaproteobacteria bacterium]